MALYFVSNKKKKKVQLFLILLGKSFAIWLLVHEVLDYLQNISHYFKIYIFLSFW